MKKKEGFKLSIKYSSQVEIVPRLQISSSLRRYLKFGSTLKENARNQCLPTSKIKKVNGFFEDQRENKINSEIQPPLYLTQFMESLQTLVYKATINMGKLAVACATLKLKKQRPFRNWIIKFGTYLINYVQFKKLNFVFPYL